MSKYSDQQIEDAFTEIRADFEKRDNSKGLEILDGYEEQWDATGSLSHRQIMWLERQLDRSWSTKAISAARSANLATEVTRPEGRTEDTGLTANEADVVLDEMIRQRLARQGQIAVERDSLEDLAAAIDALGEIVSTMADLQSHGDVA